MIHFVCVPRVCLCVCVCMCASRDCPVTGNTVPLLLSDKQQHIVGQLRRREDGGREGGRDQSASPQVSLKITDLESCHLSAVGKSQICKRRVT